LTDAVSCGLLSRLLGGELVEEFAKLLGVECCSGEVK
jgi:hypothetical protein